MLSLKSRRKYLKKLGFYKGAFTAANDKAAYLRLQKKYFSRKKDRDGMYGNDTDILLRSAWNCRDLKYFKLEEFKCHCGGKYCTGYPAVVSRSLVTKLDKKVRPKYGSTSIISGLRCARHNAAVGGVSNSKHKQGKAVDFQNKTTRKGASSRRSVISWCYRYFAYAYGNTAGMGASVHVNV